MEQKKLPKGYGVFGSLNYLSLALVKDPIKSINDSIAKFGKSYTVYIGLGKKAIFTKDADLIQYVLQKNHKNYRKSLIQSEYLSRYIGNGLLTSNGDFWLRQRRLIQPGFYKEKLNGLFQLMQTVVKEEISELPNGTYDIYSYMNKLAFNVVARSLFTTELPTDKLNELADAISAVQHFTIKDIRLPYLKPWFYLNGEKKRHINLGIRAREIIKEIIVERQESGKEYDDLLDMLLNSRYQDTNETMDMQQLIDEAFILFVAGHETTANALSWMMHLLTSHPEKIEELRAATKEYTLEDIIKSDVLAAVCKESMRLYPPAWVSDRMAYEDDEFGDFKIPKGTLIGLFFYGLHRDPQYWENPLDFEPKRFYKENAKNITTKAYQAFGSGPRMCIGNHFAMVEMNLALYEMIHQCNWKATNHNPVKEALITLRPDKVVLEVEKR